MVEKCVNCVYFSAKTQKGARYCEYILHTGVRRGCPPGNECTKYKTGKRKNKFLFNK